MQLIKFQFQFKKKKIIPKDSIFGNTIGRAILIRILNYSNNNQKEKKIIKKMLRIHGLVSPLHMLLEHYKKTCP